MEPLADLTTKCWTVTSALQGGILWSPRAFPSQLLLCLQQLTDIICMLKSADYLLQRKMPGVVSGTNRFSTAQQTVDR